MNKCKRLLCLGIVASTLFLPVMTAARQTMSATTTGALMGGTAGTLLAGKTLPERLLGGGLGALLGYMIAQQLHEVTLEEYFQDLSVHIIDDQRGTHLSMPTDQVFGTDASVSIDARYFLVLNQVAELLKQYPHIAVAISGHTDTLLPARLRYEHAMARAKTVGDYLLSRGVAGAQLKQITGAADEEPITSNDSFVGRSVNRRIEISLLRYHANPYPGPESWEAFYDDEGLFDPMPDFAPASPALGFVKDFPMFEAQSPSEDPMALPNP